MTGTGLTRRTAGMGLLAALAAGPEALAQGARAKPRLYFLGGGGLMTTALDGTGLKTLVPSTGGLFDGLAWDPTTKFLYWTNMGRANADDGTITRAKLDGTGVKVVVQPGGTYTPKQLKIDVKGRKLYWSDREGMRIMRSNMDGTNIETLVQTGSGDEERKDQSRWCVGIGIDTVRGHVYWTQKGGDNAGTGSIKRAALNIPRGQTAANRTDIEVLFASQPEPIDIDLDLSKRVLYWTDRGNNTVSRAPMDMARRADPARREDRQELVTGLKEAIGVTLDLPGRRMFYTSLGGEVGTSGLDGAGAKILLTGQRSLTGIVMV